MKNLFTTCLILVGCASFTTVSAQNTVTTKQQVCVESRNDLIPMATLGNVPANAKFVGNIVADKTYYCESAKKVEQVTAPAAMPSAPVEKMQRPTRRRPDPKR